MGWSTGVGNVWEWNHVDNAASVVMSHWIRAWINGSKRVGNWWMAFQVLVPVVAVVGGRRLDPDSMPWVVGSAIGWIGFWMKTTIGVTV